MKLASFEIENFKRINFVSYSIDPKTNDLIITGENEQGKSATLEGLYAGFAGISSKEVPQPIKEGEDKATINMLITDDGDKPLYVIQRIITEKTERLVVSSPEGAQYPTPQALLATIYDKATIDVSAFLNLDAKKQFEQLKDIVKIKLDFDKLAEERKEIYDERTAANSRLKDLKGELAGIELPPEDEIPKERIDVAAQLKLQTAAQEKIRVNNAERDSLPIMVRNLAGEEEALEELQEELKSLLEDIEKQKKDVEINKTAVKEKEEAVKKLEDPDIAAINSTISDAQRINAIIDNVEEHKELEKRIGKGEELIAEKTEGIKAKDKIKEDALKAAKFPVKGLSFSDDGILYKGIPFTQASSEEKIQVALAIGMSKKPKVQLILIRDASLLDKKNLKVVQEFAKKTGFLVIMERVDDESPTSIVIQDGYMLDKKGEKLLPPEQKPKKNSKKKAENGSSELF